jgi:hypothetical protein
MLCTQPSLLRAWQISFLIPSVQKRVVALRLIVDIERKKGSTTRSNNKRNLCVTRRRIRLLKGTGEKTHSKLIATQWHLSRVGSPWYNHRATEFSAWCNTVSYKSIRNACIHFAYFFNTIYKMVVSVYWYWFHMKWLFLVSTDTGTRQL